MLDKQENYLNHHDRILIVGSPTSQIFNVSGAPSHLQSYVTLPFNPTSCPLGVPITFTIQAIDGEGIVPTADIVGAFPFQLTLIQTDLSNVTYNNTFLVPYTVVSQQNGVWNVTCTPTRSLNTTGDLNRVGFYFT